MSHENIAYCGLLCEQCSFKTAHDENDPKHLADIPYPFTQHPLSVYDCDGCKSGHCICGVCKIKPCASAKGIAHCSECVDFPCELINAFETDGMPHHRDAVENLHKIREIGLESWYETIKPQLKCSCGQIQTWYYRCPRHQQK